MNKLLVLIPLMPFLGFLLNGLLRTRLSKSAAGLIGCGVILVSFVLSVIAFIDVRSGKPILDFYFNFIDTAGINIPFSLQADQLSVLFMLIITGIGLLIHIYSTSYMHGENNAHFARYFAYLNLFVFSMLLLVMGANYVIMFIGWEGVGLCSYLLIGYWFKKTEYNNAAKKAFVMNRIGDLAFLIALFWLLQKTGTLNFVDLFGSQAKPGNLGNLGQADYAWITLLLFIGATGKSAQIPLYTWLPDAMAGPTPVSALIHAATMVTAGIYMIVRSNVLYTMAPITMNIIAVVGLATAILSATIALKQNDIKKVLAYSTVSQLGFMFLAIGVSAYTTSVFHVMTHAFFKALLFLGAGSVIHAMGGEQDVTKMGGLWKKIPITAWTFLLGVLAIAGFPGTSGFVSKDEILINVYNYSPVMFWFAAFAAVLTAFYMLRLFMLTFMGGFRGTSDQAHHLHESPKSMTIPLIILAILSVFGGLIQFPHIFGGHAYLDAWLAPVIGGGHAAAHAVDHSALANREYMLLAGTVIGLIIIYIVTKRKYAVSGYNEKESSFGKVLANKWYVDELYETIIVKPIQWLGKVLNGFVEKTGLDGAVNGIGKGLHAGARQLRLLQNGQTAYYLLYMVLGVALLFILLRTDWVRIGKVLGGIF